jgi:hypothetical protein
MRKFDEYLARLKTNWGETQINKKNKNDITSSIEAERINKRWWSFIKIYTPKIL